ncbi:tail fiber domain-containing protein [Aquimonas sp.]|jgi:hypothetical protein|uniref:tail fiber domain-containing protein n=1 Tax=Aquimonas sp. TaxID=1872588 RepID=UPI0037C17CD1
MRISILTLALAGVLSALPAAADTLSFRGHLEDREAPANGRYDLRLSVHADAKRAAPLGWPIEFPAVTVTDGAFELEFDLPAGAEEAWVELSVRAPGEATWSAIPGRTKATAATAAIGQCWSSTGDDGSNPALNFLGTTDAQPLVLRTRNVQSLRLEPSTILFNGTSITANIIAGSSANSVTPGVRGATIAGGGVPSGESDPDYFDEAPNRVADAYGTVGGGYNNRAGDGAGSVTDRGFATVSGGYSNEASGTQSFVGGGFRNAATEIISTVSGGSSNTASGTASIVGGGSSNTASGTASIVSGGNGNSASGSSSTIGGGDSNLASGQDSVIGGGRSNTASGSWSTAAAGRDNMASGPNSVVVGGSNNTASGVLSAVSGGIGNCAGGDASWAGGREAKVRPGAGSGAGADGCAGVPESGDTDGDNGTFVWADDQGSSFVSTGSRQFLVRAQGGMAINTNTPAAGAALTVNGNLAIATTGTLGFGSQTRQMLNLWGPASYGIGVQSDRLYFRSFSGFSWFQGGAHNDAADNAGTGGTLRMRLSNTGQLQTSTGTISTLSDARLKDEIADYSGALDRINALRPVTYHYRDAGKAAFQPEGTHLGFVAQEMQQVFPQWVSEGDDGHLMLSMRGFEAVAVGALQELSAESALQSEQDTRHLERLSALEAENAELRSRLNAVERALAQLAATPR